jgi:aryl-alcohol dehydrogenase-like predicted oxidoreductase
VRYIGCSNFKAWQVVQGLWVSERNGLSSFVCIQPKYNLLQRIGYEGELQSVAEAYGLGVIPYSPLAAGLLTGKYEHGQPAPAGSRVSRSSLLPRLMESDRTWGALECLRRIGAEHQASLSQAALAWILRQPGVTSPIIGPRTVEQLVDNAGAADVDLTDSEVAEISQTTAEAS